MRVIKTCDSALSGYKYCIEDEKGNIIGVYPTRDSRERDFWANYVDGDKMVDVLFDKPKG